MCGFLRRARSFVVFVLGLRLIHTFDLPHTDHQSVLISTNLASSFIIIIIIHKTRIPNSTAQDTHPYLILSTAPLVRETYLTHRHQTRRYFTVSLSFLCLQKSFPPLSPTLHRNPPRSFTRTLKNRSHHPDSWPQCIVSHCLHYAYFWNNAAENGAALLCRELSLLLVSFCGFAVRLG